MYFSSYWLEMTKKSQEEIIRDIRTRIKIEEHGVENVSELVRLSNLLGYIKN